MTLFQFYGFVLPLSIGGVALLYAWWETHH